MARREPTLYATRLTWEPQSVNLETDSNHRFPARRSPHSGKGTVRLSKSSGHKRFTCEPLTLHTD